jgi:hypothetical protein
MGPDQNFSITPLTSANLAGSPEQHTQPGQENPDADRTAPEQDQKQGIHRVPA